MPKICLQTHARKNRGGRKTRRLGTASNMIMSIAYYAATFLGGRKATAKPVANRQAIAAGMKAQ